jgi:hypothetical protein
MSVLAVSFARVDARYALASTDVLGLRDWLEVIRVEAGSIAAQVIDLQADRNWAAKHLP